MLCAAGPILVGDVVGAGTAVFTAGSPRAQALIALRLSEPGSRRVAVQRCRAPLTHPQSRWLHLRHKALAYDRTCHGEATWFAATFRVNDVKMTLR